MEKRSDADILKDSEKPDEAGRLVKVKDGQRQPVRKLKRSCANDELQSRERSSQQKVRIQDHTLASTSQNMAEFQDPVINIRRFGRKDLKKRVRHARSDDQIAAGKEEPKANTVNITAKHVRVQNIAKNIVAPGGNMKISEIGGSNVITIGDGSMNVEGCKPEERVKKVKKNGKEKGQKTKKFLKTINDDTKEKIRYDVCGKRESLNKVEKPPQPLCMIVKIEKSGTDEQRPKVKAIGKIGKSSTEEQGPKVKDIRQVELNEIHDGLGRHTLLVGDAGEGKTTSSKQYAENVLNNQTCLRFASR